MFLLLRLICGRSGDRIPVGARFSAPVQTGPGAYPASCTMGTGSFLGVKRPEHGVDHPPPSKCRGQERVGLYLYSPSRPQWPVIGRPFTQQFFMDLCIISYWKYTLRFGNWIKCFFTFHLGRETDTVSETNTVSERYISFCRKKQCTDSQK